MDLKVQIERCFELRDIVCENLNTPTNDVVAITAPGRRFALKLYISQSRAAADVQWELDLINHLIKNGAPVVKPVAGKDGYVQTFVIEEDNRIGVLFEWASGEKPTPNEDTYNLLGKTAAQIHEAADTFVSTFSREEYGTDALIDDPLRRMQQHLTAAGKWQQIVDMGERLKQKIANSELDWGVCHMDLTLDNVFRSGDTLTVFDFDSAGKSWRAVEPHMILKLPEKYFTAWLNDYRSIRSFMEADEQAVAAFAVVGDLRVVAWDLGVARSSRGKPKIGITELAGIADEWLDWCSTKV